MSIGPALYGRLSLTAAGARTYPLKLPQNPTFPAITYRIISTERRHNFGQSVAGGVARVQVDSWANTTYKAAQALAAEVLTALSRYNTTPIHDVTLQSEQDLYESDTGLYRVMHDYLIYFED